MAPPEYLPAWLPPFAPPAGCSGVSDDGSVIDNLRSAGVHMLRDDPAHHALLVCNAAACVDDMHPEFTHDLIVLVEHSSLKQPEAFHRVRAPAEIHARFIEFQLDPARQQAID